MFNLVFPKLFDPGTTPRPRQNTSRLMEQFEKPLSVKLYGSPEEDAMSAVGQGSLHPRPKGLESELGSGGQFRQAGSVAPRLGH